MTATIQPKAEAVDGVLCGTSSTKAPLPIPSGAYPTGYTPEIDKIIVGCTCSQLRLQKGKRCC